ncbi:MAG: methylamine utilization protein MauG [Campylobacteraceae bacterium]|nr:methylamine utilization protein MauG [Campylobacteraceae bacterium]
MKKLYISKVFAIFSLVIFFTGCGNSSSDEESKKIKEIKIIDYQTKEDLGKALFFDKNLSKNRTQSCVTCHNPEHAFVDKRESSLMKELKQAVSVGDDKMSIGNRNTPTINYAMLTPDYHYTYPNFIGGMFHDGRAKNLQEQAGMPLLNPVEMNMSSKREVISRIKENKNYINAFNKMFNTNILNNEEKAYLALTSVLATFEKSKVFNSFDSKYDLYLEGKYKLKENEKLGLELFFSSDKTNCTSCHLVDELNKENKKETFTSYEYFKLGIPQNYLVHDIRVNLNLEKEETIDNGLFENKRILFDKQFNREESTEYKKGAFKTPTLRNIAITSPYMHNGLFQKLDTVLKFYEFRRDVTSYPINPETNQTWNESETKGSGEFSLGNGKGLNQNEINAIISFLKLLTDKQYEHLLK